MQVEIKGRLDPLNTSHHSLHNLLFPFLLPTDMKVKTYGTTICLFYMGVKPGLSDGENRGWWSFKRVLRKIFGPKTEQWRCGENCTVRSFIICDPWRILFRPSNKG